jgi:hypothetical protein
VRAPLQVKISDGAATLKDVRHVTLSRIRYHLYYRVAGDSLEVLALWHTSLGRPPDL